MELPYEKQDMHSCGMEEQRGKGSATKHRKAGLGLVFVGNFFCCCFGGFFFMTAFKFMSHKHQTWFLLLLSNVHHRVLKVSVMLHLVL